MLKRNIKQVAVLGSGIMGSQIACHFANIGVQVLLLDLPYKPTEEEVRKGVNTADPRLRNKLVQGHLDHALKMNPSPIFHPDLASNIRVGNFEDDLPLISGCDWVMEVVVERLDIKRQLFEKVEAHRKPGTLVTTNTSGIPVHLMTEDRSQDFRKHFCGTHFFNPPRYLKLLEIIPGPETDPLVTDFLLDYGDRYLGKTTVLAKDRPAFIGNRIGVYGIMALFHAMKELGLTVEEVDKLTGPVLGRPKSATFRTADVVGLDTLVHVANGLYENLKEDEERETFKLPDYIASMTENNWLGSKSGQGFYKKVQQTDGSSAIHVLDLNTMEYVPSSKVRFATLEQTKTIDKVIDRFPVLIGGTDKAGEFYRKSFGGLFAYAANRIPEIADELYRIDDALRGGFGWEHGPFQIWDAVGLAKGVELIESAGKTVAPWVLEMQKAGYSSFYAMEDGVLKAYHPQSGKYQPVQGISDYIILDHIRPNKTVWSNAESSILDLGDGILNFEVHSKMNTLGGGVLSGLNKAIDLAEKNYRGLVVGNQGANFSVGANLGMIFMMAAEQDWDELYFAIKYFQDSMMRVRYSDIPVVVAPHGMTLGGGCEMTLHADAVQAAAETYIGLVEFGVGVIPGGGGTKELTLRASDRYLKDDVELNTYREYYLNIGMAKVATSAEQAFHMNILRRGQDRVTMNRDRQLAEAKQLVLTLADAGYTRPAKRKAKVLGRQALGMFHIGAHQMVAGNYISKHDELISQKLAWVMAGGDLSEPAWVSEDYLLRLEREAFLSLCGERKTLERIQHMLKTGKPLRN